VCFPLVCTFVQLFLSVRLLPLICTFVQLFLSVRLFSSCLYLCSIVCICACVFLLFVPLFHCFNMCVCFPLVCTFVQLFLSVRVFSSCLYLCSIVSICTSVSSYMHFCSIVSICIKTIEQRYKQEENTRTDKNN
jgi:hypothetical protein